jgi:hypothetical protein
MNINNLVGPGHFLMQIPGVIQKTLENKALGPT